MKVGDRGPMKTIIDREKLMRLKTCAACSRPFNLETRWLWPVVPGKGRPV